MCQKKAAKIDLIYILCQSHLKAEKSDNNKKRWGTTLEKEGDGWEGTGKEGDSDMAL